jgi:hypothetical protein
MHNLFRTVMICILLSIALFSPAFLYKAIIYGRNLYHAHDYVKIKIKVDSVHVDSNNAGDGNIATGVYHIYNYENNLKFSFTDRTGHLLGDDGIIPHMHSYMNLHQDSILIWYNPNSEIKYAREEESEFSRTEDYLFLIINSILVVIAVLHIRWQIQYYKDRKAKQIGYDKK